MSEEKNGANKNKWSRLFKKKWFFPAVYLTVAAILLIGVVWYQNVGNQIPDADNNQEMTGNDQPDLYDKDAESVMEQAETIKMPVNDQEKAEIVTKFYDASADEEDQEDALVSHNDRYYQSTGVDIALGDDEDETFEVVASLSGKVEEVKEDPVLGNVVTLSHKNDAKTYYASMDDIEAETGDTVKQGDTLGKAGNNLLGKDIGHHVHFELRKGDKSLDPEEFFNQSLSELEKINDDDEDEADDDKADNDDSGNNNDNQDADKDKETDADQNDNDNNQENNTDSNNTSGDMDDDNENNNNDNSDSNADNETNSKLNEDIHPNLPDNEANQK